MPADSSVRGLCFGAVARRGPLIHNNTMCRSISHISFHKTNNNFQEVQEEGIGVGQRENTAGVWFLFVDGSSHRRLTESFILTVLKWSVLFGMETEQPRLLRFMLNVYTGCQ